MIQIGVNSHAPGPEDLIEDLGIRLVRTEVGDHLSDADLDIILRRFAARPSLTPLLEIRVTEDRIQPFCDHAFLVLTHADLPSGAWFEIGNEPDLASMGPWADQPSYFGLACRAVYDALRAKDFAGPIISGGISTLGPRGLDYLRAMDWAGLPADLVCGVHSYAHHKDEIAKLRAIIGDREIAVTETGQSMKPSGWWCFKTAPSEEDVGRFLCQEFDYWQAHGALCCCVFLWADGGPGDDDRWGLVSADGRVKAQGAAAQQWIERHR